MKTNFKLFLTVTLILTGIFSLFFVSNGIKVFAQVEDEIVVETTGYSILGPSSFVFGGYYSGNFDKKPFTTYFEFKKDDSNLGFDSEDLLKYFNLLDKDKQETIKIVRDSNVEEYNDFYSSPELQSYSTYFFRAVGCFNDDIVDDKYCIEGKKYYGETLYMRTGYIPYGMAYPLTTIRNNKVLTAMLSANILVENITENSADFKTTVLNENFKDLDLKIEYGEKNFDSKSDILQLNDLGKSIITIDGLKPKTKYQYRLSDTTNKLKPTHTQTFTTKSTAVIPPLPTPPKDFSGGLVPCDGSVANPCEFDQFLKLINTVIDFIFTNLVIPIAAIMFAYAGFELITSGGETSKREKAKGIFTNVAIGLIIAVAAFLIVQTILLIVGYDTGNGWDWFGF